MSTRCNIIIKWQNKKIVLYHHHDGYPEGVGRDLKFYLSKIHYWCDEAIARNLVKNTAGLRDNEYEPSMGLHGDIEYVYEIDCRREKLTCYEIDWLAPKNSYKKNGRKVEIPAVPADYQPMYWNSIAYAQ